LEKTGDYRIKLNEFFVIVSTVNANGVKSEDAA